MKWTPLHDALGASEPNALSFQMALDAVAAQVPESQTLDFKKALPLPADLDKEAKAGKQSELAKDISAMANAGGGMLLYGIDESRGVDLSTAAEICSVGAPNDTVEKDIRTVASSLIQPPVRHLEFAWLIEEPPFDGDSDDEFVPRTVLALLVPDSADRPHLVHPPKGNGDWFAAHYRNGTHTHLMNDVMLQRAFIEREQGQQRIEEDFEKRFEEFCKHLPGQDWVVLMAVPERVQRHGVELDLAIAEKTFRRGFAGSRGIWRAPSLLKDEATRLGLRRFLRARTFLYDAPNGREQWKVRARAEIHADGAVALAFSRGGYFDLMRERPETPAFTSGHFTLRDVNSVVNDFSQFLWAAREQRPVGGDYRARLHLHPAVTHFRNHAGEEKYLPLSDQDRVLHFPPIEARLFTRQGDESVLDSLQQMLIDVYAQAGEDQPPIQPGASLLRDYGYVSRRLG